MQKPIKHEQKGIEGTFQPARIDIFYFTVNLSNCFTPKRQDHIRILREQTANFAKDKIV